jgi:hypothetical protein
VTFTQDDAVVVFNVVGGLADMSLFSTVFADGRTPAAWRKFFARIVDAKVIEENRDLVHAVARLGYTVSYSSTFPEATRVDTLGWLAAHDFPEGALFLRPDDNLTHARRIKYQHCRAIPEHKRRLRAFVDDDIRAMNFLRNRRIPGQTFEYLLGLRVQQIRHEFDVLAFRANMCELRPSVA